MLKTQYEQGQRDALARFKIANLAGGAKAYNPTLNGQAAGGANNTLSAKPMSAATPMAADVAKSKVLG